MLRVTVPSEKPRFLSPLAKGYLVMLMVLLIWSGLALTVRGISMSPLQFIDVALIRFAVPVILFAPFISAHYAEIKRARVSDLLFILLGGIPFLLFAALGAETAPTAYVGTILAGTPPLFVAVLSFVVYRKSLPIKRALALSLILMGVVVMVVGRSDVMSANIHHGVLYLLSAAIVWAFYTMGLIRADLSAISVAIILSYSSFLIVLTLLLLGVFPTSLGSFSWQDALPFILVQGLGIGVLATLGFSYAVQRLGSAKSSVIGSISPSVTALLAVPIFGESLTVAIVGGILLTIAGVILSNRI